MTEKLIEISRKLGFKDLEERLAAINATMSNGQAELIVPLVGEFSAGKTTLVNALTDSKALECASKPTTATIYTIHFGAESNKAIVHNPDGTTREVGEISDLKNDELKDVVVVDVFDTSRRVPDSIVIVDTPGLSSNDIKHRQNLVNFLPQADAIILVSDIQQGGLTRSLTDFAKTIALSNRPIYVALAQCDTKSEADIKHEKEYLLKNTELPINGVVCISAKHDKMDELYSLLHDLQQDKTAILARVNEYRSKEIAKELCARIDTLLNSSQTDSSIDDAIREQQLKLNKIRRHISSLIESISSDLDGLQREVSRKFEDKIFERLDTIVSGKSENFDAEAISAINNTSSLLLNDYKTNVIELLAEKVKEQSRKDSELSIDGIQSLDMSQYAVSGISYNLNLNEAGHEYDGKIAGGLKIAAAVAAVAVTMGAASGAAGAAAAGEAGAVAAGEAGAAAAGGLTSAQTVLVAADVADTVTDVGSIIANRRHANRINQAIQYGSQINDKLGTVNDLDASAGQRMGRNKGIVESLVGFVTERTMGKPQRRRAIHNYIDMTLAPTFADEMRRITAEVSRNISNNLNGMAETQSAELTSSLEALKKTRQEQKSAFDERIKELKQLKQQINSI
ncbi:MAG: dynamin family protein [Muribaculaceae bacterium]|nr:dynamin family protein [Muribaculaceae bacterium]